MRPGDRLTKLTNRVIGILNVHADGCVRDHATCRPVVGIQGGVSQRDVEIKSIVKNGLLHRKSPASGNVT